MQDMYAVSYTHLEKKNEESIETEAQETVENEGMQTVTDSVGRSVEIPNPVTKAVVANAYNTEIINAIDALDLSLIHIFITILRRL